VPGGFFAGVLALLFATATCFVARCGRGVGRVGAGLGEEMDAAPLRATAWSAVAGAAGAGPTATPARDPAAWGARLDITA
jgi:hypothetical protein